ncbi:hypothetical protein [Pseudomonas denitrificans (nom. rej.)]|uniref:hypothetical protein n=1 Tax=Pseudomonas denitrificans TaxID=43306 RepID=UPI00142F1B95
MTNPSEQGPPRQAQPKQPSSTPKSFVSAEQAWVLNAITKVETNLEKVYRAVRVVNRKVENVDKKHAGAVDTVKGWGDVPGHITDTKVFIAKTDVRLDHIDRNMVTKGQLATYGVVILVAILGGGWWVVQQYLAPCSRTYPNSTSRVHPRARGLIRRRRDLALYLSPNHLLILRRGQRRDLLVRPVLPLRFPAVLLRKDLGGLSLRAV